MSLATDDILLHSLLQEWRPYGVIAVITPFYLQCAALGEFS